LKGQKYYVSRLKTEKGRHHTFVIPPMVYFETKRWLAANKVAAKLEAFEALDLFGNPKYVIQS
jgi:hypothetical protein